MIFLNDVYNNLLSNISHSFHRFSDQLASAKLYTRTSTKINVWYFQVMPFRLGFHTKVVADILSSYCVDEVLIDLNFYTKQDKPELFCVILLGFRTGFILAEFALEAETGDIYRLHEGSISDSLMELGKELHLFVHASSSPTKK